MTFWDTSAIVPLLVREPASEAALDLLERDPELLVWWGTPIERLSALARLEREGRMAPRRIDEARARLGRLRASRHEILASEPLRLQAERALRIHSLRAADALQLGAALVWAGGRPEERAFASLDDRLRLAARAEGFRLVPEEG